MKLTASPFDPQTGELLPVYRDAYLRGDLSKASAQAVEAYLHRDADQAHSTLTRWQELQAAQDAALAPSWVNRQIQYIRAEPVRFRRRATTLVASAVLVGTMVFAGTPTENLPTGSLPTDVAATEVLEAGASAEMASSAASLRMITVRGQIKGENGQPLVGATVMQPGSLRGVSTNAQGEYVLTVPAGTSSLKYGYGGYHDEEVAVKGSRTADVTLLPRAQQKKRWLFF
ncbi:carboxypeptidase-like regulatory domain-containing protein [Hymenobacter sp. 5516J-16]|uniref:carboxypeptidase-like regulatory domain-containing protein n=1 Tax=Hymenobacter sp. 5516J-16 TaxID=2932253 RepID=UPI001FD29052|nr:carboxypeptidase-like regulatory domain-containing protein [Hymenobacter sp. 5516J-16]UOQ78798.1 carboxypeptidase-like regulatory domain-containing protein [Hymenobacter sp. 5516J-16]